MAVTDPGTGDARWMRRFHPAPADAPRLVLLPHAGGSASFFRPLATALAERFDVLTAQYPGRQDRRAEPPIEDLTEYADRIHRALPSDGRPLALYGHSMGALLAFEVARRLEAAGRAPLAVVVSGRRAPSVHREDTVHLRDDSGLIAELRELSATHSSLLADEEVVRMILPALRGDYTAVERWTCPADSVLTAPLLALTGDADRWTGVDDTAAWAAHTTGAFRWEVLDGGHFFVVDHWQRLSGLVSGFVLDALGAVEAPAALGTPA
ncbi:thioesterase II family protein [Kitasatospora sp. NPDC059327]|uniref:thioesterase II family protein n=1 Tax=Kitasatospora sp. NPDC059327 TaxID=3346803 RepID=UPI0036B56004